MEGHGDRVRSLSRVLLVVLVRSTGPEVDHDCNGISGMDESGVSYEDKFCSGTERRGLVILGDSATAHFHLPPAWLTANGWDPEIVFSNQCVYGDRRGIGGEEVLWQW